MLAMVMLFAAIPVVAVDEYVAEEIICDEFAEHTNIEEISASNLACLIEHKRYVTSEHVFYNDVEGNCKGTVRFYACERSGCGYTSSEIIRTPHNYPSNWTYWTKDVHKKTCTNSWCATMTYEYHTITGPSGGRYCTSCGATGF